MMSTIGEEASTVYHSLKRLEYVLNNKTESFPNKVESLIQVWKQVSQCRLTEHKQYVVHLMDWLKLHTLNIVLTGDWKKFKDVYEERLLKEVKHCEMLLLHSNNIFSLRCRKLAEVIKDPWGSPILNKLLNNSDVTVGPEEIEFFSMETGYLISTRLRKLCESHCEDLALNLVTTFMRCHQMAEVQHFSLNATEDQKRFILDVYIALLYKYKKTSLIISTLKSLSLKEGLELLKRFAHKRVNISKIWRHSNRIAHLAAQVYVTATVMKPPEESVSILEGLLETWLSLNESNDNLDSLMSAIRRIIQAADSAVHMYIFCEAVHKKFGPNMKTFTIELYIRALTTDMNDLERQKNEDDSVKVVEISKRLAHGFLRLADVLEEHIKVSRECVLTSFSLQPTQTTLDKLAKLAERSGYEILDTGQNWKCKLHPPVESTDEVCFKCDLCGDFMSQPHLQSPLNTNTALSEALTAEQLGLSRQLCDDLVVVLSSPRYQLLNWLLPWQDLHRLCVIYLNDPERTKNLVTELKFLDIDYSIFMGMKREPEDEELTGIERGYEHYLEEELYPEERISPSSEDSGSQDSRPYSLGSDGMGEVPALFPPPAIKSDPNVLKSLRLFRPSLKRVKSNQVEDELPPKVFVTSESISPLTTAQTTTSFARPHDPHPFYMPIKNYSNRHNPHLNNLLSTQLQQYYSSNISNAENWHMMGQSNPEFAAAEPLNFTINQAVHSYSSPEANFRNTSYNFLVGSNTNTHQETYNDTDNPYLNDSNGVALNLCMNNPQTEHTEMERSEEYTECSLNLTKENTNFEENASKPYDHPQDTSKKLDESSSNILTVEENIKSVTEKFPIDSENSSVCKQEQNSNICNRTSQLENFHLDHEKLDSPEKIVEKITVISDISSLELALESSMKIDTNMVKDTSHSPPIPCVDLSKNLLPSVNSDVKNEENDCQINLSSEDLPKNLVVSENNSEESKKVLCCSPIPPDSSKNSLKSGTEKALCCSPIPPDSSKNALKGGTEKALCCSPIPPDSSKNSLKIGTEKALCCSPIPSDSSKNPLQSGTEKDENECFDLASTCETTSENLNVETGETKETQVSATLPIPYVDMSKNVLTFASSGVQKQRENHCLQKNTDNDPEAKAAALKLYNKLLEILYGEKQPEAIEPKSSLVRIDYNKNFSQEKKYDRGKQKVDNALQRKRHAAKTNKLADLFKKYKLKEARVVLHRLILTDDYSKKKYADSASEFIKPPIPKQKAQRKTTKKSENKTKEKSRGKSSPLNKNKNDLKPWPLQDINPKVNRRSREVKSHVLNKKGKCKGDFKTDVKFMNPCVVLKRLEFDAKDKKRIANSLLANVPGLNDLQMIRPSSVDRIVQVVQVPGTRCATTSVPVQGTQTSTQVTPHIQRIGQPRTEKPESSDADSTSTTSGVNTTSSTVTTTMSESSTLINILSQQIIRPGNQSNCIGVRPRTSPLINILSQQIIKPATTVSSSTKISSSSAGAEVQVNSIPRVITGGDQILSQLINPIRAPAPTLKTLVSAPVSDQNRIVQFICKASDGKLIPVTSFTSNKVVKVSMTQTVSSSIVGNTSTDESFTKLVQTTCKTKPETAENSDTLPKFQQAFGKPAYQNNIESTECVTTNNDSINADIEKSGSTIKTQPKNSSTSLNVQPVQGGVIYTRQMPVGQTINLIPPGRGQVFRIATSNAEQLSLVKDTVIHGKMSALLAAALQGKQRTLDNNEMDITSEESSQANSRVAVTTRPALVQNARIVKPVLQIPSNVIRSTPQSNLSSTTLEQLREFDMVYKQVKERSSTSVPTESSPQSDSSEPTQQISVTYLNQGQKINCAPVVVVSSYCNVQPAASPSLSVTSQGSSSPCVTPAPTLALSSKTVTKSPKSKSIKSATTHTTKASPIPKPQQKPQEDEHTTQRIFDILAEYAEQLRNSPDLNNKPAPRRRSNPPTNPNQNAKRKKSSSSKKTGHCSNSLTSDGDIEDTHTVGSEDSSCGVVQISVQEEEQPLTTVSTSETSEASVSPKQLILTDSTPSQSRSLIIADSNVGEALKMSNTAVLVPGNYIMPVSMVKGGQQIAVVSGGSKILATVPARSGPNMLLFQSFLNQTRKHGLPTVKYSAVQPISGIARNLASITAQTAITTPPTSQNLTAVTLAQTVSLQKVHQLDRTDINNFDTELLLTIAHPTETKSIVEQQQSDHRGISSSIQSVQSLRVGDAILNSENSPEKSFSYVEKSLVNASVATSVIAQSIHIKEELPEEQPTTAQAIMALNLNSSEGDKDTTIKVEGRVQSVLVATGTSNGPMLSHSPPAYSKQTDSTNSISESNKDEYLRNEGKRNSAEPKTLQSSVYAYQGKIKKTQMGSQRLDRELQQLSLQRKQAALERELRLQKSLSEECEDLGVDEPSTSDLFPEADLLFDSNHSPSFDQTSQDLVKRPQNVQEIKEETKTIGLFCDDEPMRTDFLFEPIEYQSAAVELEYDRTRDITNGQGSTSNESGLSCEDNTLLQTCTSMSDVTIPSPISPDPYGDNSPPPLNKCKYKYSNRKKAERSKQMENWPMELSSSEDTTGSTELAKSCSRSPELYPGKRNQSLSCDEELYGFAIVERLPLKDEEECEEVHCEEVVDCPSGRGARRSVKKLCSCCNGSARVARKRPASRPPTPFSHKKTVIAKKR